MAEWAGFLALVGGLVVVVLVLARRSSALVRGEQAAEPVGRSVTEPPGGAVDPARVELTAGVLLVNVLATQGVIAGVVLAAIALFDIPWWAVGLGEAVSRTGPGLVAAALGLGVALWLGSEAAGRLADAAGVAYDERLRERLAPESAPGWLGLFLVVLPVIALAEELLFRGALIGVPAAATGLGPWPFVGLSAALFALGHGAQGRVGIAATGVLGLVLGAAFVLTENLLLVIGAHYVVNALEFGVHEALGAGGGLTAPRRP